MKFTLTERVAIAVMACLLCFVASAIGVWLFMTASNSALDDEPDIATEPPARVEQAAPQVTETPSPAGTQTDTPKPTETATRVVPLTAYTPVDTGTPTPTVTHTPTATPTRPSPTPTAVPTSTPIVIHVTVIPQQAAPPPAVPRPAAPGPAAPPVPDRRCEESENAYHQASLASIESTYRSIISQIDRQIESAIRDRDARRVLDLQSEKKSYESQKASEINAENSRHNAAIAACRR